jgi:predicted enzyme related to lactoylglutathione lyase
MFYGPQADELRRFFRDQLGLAHFDAGEGWLIFPMAGEIGFHPDSTSRQDVSLYCDDIRATVEELKGRGVQFTQEIEDHGYGYVTFFSAPGGLTIQLYEPKYGKG